MKHSVDMAYTAQVEKMMSWYNEHGGIIMPGSLTEIIPTDIADTNTDVDFLSTLYESEDMNYHAKLVVLPKKLTPHLAPRTDDNRHTRAH